MLIENNREDKMCLKMIYRIQDPVYNSLPFQSVKKCFSRTRFKIFGMIYQVKISFMQNEYCSVSTVKFTNRIYAYLLNK